MGNQTNIDNANNEPGYKSEPGEAASGASAVDPTGAANAEGVAGAGQPATADSSASAAGAGQSASAATAATAADAPKSRRGGRNRRNEGNGKQAKKARGRTGLRRPKISTIIALVVLLAGVGIMAYPTFSDWWNSYHQSRAIASYVEAVQGTDPEVIEKMLADAQAYNQRLLTNGNRYKMSDEELAEYESLLDLTGNGVMGYVQINAIGVDYPIYHGMDENVLQIAIGHLEGTSLPIGGPSTHAAISGHRGLPRAKLFTDLDKLVEGDTFTVTVLDTTCTYEIDQIRIVLPTDLSDLNIEPGQDYCTLITCTPYGINTHRMLVRGHRIDNIINEDVVTAEALQIPRYIAIPAVAVPILFAFLVGMLIYYRVRRPAADLEHVAEVVRAAAHEEEELRK